MEAKFTIYKVKNGYLLNVTKGGSVESFVYNERERMVMFAKIDDVCGEEPVDSVGMEAQA